MIGFGMGLRQQNAIIPPALNLDFTGGVLPSGITYSRSGPATRVNSSGIIESVSDNVPRFDIDPVTLACRGILREPSRTNLIVDSTNFSSNWSLTGVSATANAAIAPDGTLSAYKLTEDAANNNHQWKRGVAGLSAGTYTFSVFVKAAGRNWFGIYNDTTAQGYSFNLATGTLGSGFIQTAPGAAIAPAGNGWYRCSVNITITGNGLGLAPLLLNGINNYGYTGDGTSGIYIWGAQLEAGSVISSYIPTTSAGYVTRNAETIGSPAFGSWFNPVQGTILVDCLSTNFSTPFAVGLFRNAASGHIQAVENNNSSRMLNNSGAYVLSATMNAQPLTTARRKTALAYLAGDSAIARSGVIQATSTTTDLPTGINQFVLVDSNFTGVLASAKYYNTRLPNPTLIAYTS